MASQLQEHKKRPALLPAFAEVVARLEGEACSKLAGERTRQRAAGRVDETDWVSKSRKPHSSVEVIPVIGMVGQVEGLEHQLQVAAFTQLDVLCQTSIQVKVRIAT